MDRGARGVSVRTVHTRIRKTREKQGIRRARHDSARRAGAPPTARAKERRRALRAPFSVKFLLYVGFL